MLSAAAHAHGAAGDTVGAIGTPIQTNNETIRAGLLRIASRSALWRAALDDLRGTGRHVLVLTPDQVAVSDAIDSARREPFDPKVLAEVAPVADSESRVQRVLVVINLPLIEELHSRRNSLPGELHADLDRILVHEIYGHAVPYLHAGSLAGRCPDPARGQPAAEACSIRRENAIREEMGFSLRTSYGLQELLLTRVWR